MRALAELTLRYDKLDLGKVGLKVTEAEIAGARAKVDKKTLDALEFAYDRILDHHKRQLPQDDVYKDRQGVELGTRWTPVASAGLYVPGGTASYPSSVLMNAVPAKVAGVKRIVMAVPAPGGVLNPLVLVAAELAGVSEIYRLGGAQAIAALAYGTAEHRAGRQDRRPGQRLCRGGQAASVRPGRHRHGGRAVGGGGDRRQGQRPGLDRRRPAGSGRARCRGAGHPDHRR